MQVIAFLKGSKRPDAINRFTVFFSPELNPRLAGIASHTLFINPMPPLCDGLDCVYQDHGVFLFEDYGHFSAVGSARVVDSLFLRDGRSLIAEP